MKKIITIAIFVIAFTCLLSISASASSENHEAHFVIGAYSEIAVDYVGIDFYYETPGVAQATTGKDTLPDGLQVSVDTTGYVYIEGTPAENTQPGLYNIQLYTEYYEYGSSTSRQGGTTVKLYIEEPWLYISGEPVNTYYIDTVFNSSEGATENVSGKNWTLTYQKDLEKYTLHLNGYQPGSAKGISIQTNKDFTITYEGNCSIYYSHMGDTMKGAISHYGSGALCIQGTGTSGRLRIKTEGDKPHAGIYSTGELRLKSSDTHPIEIESPQYGLYHTPVSAVIFRNTYVTGSESDSGDAFNTTIKGGVAGIYALYGVSITDANAKIIATSKNDSNGIMCVGTNSISISNSKIDIQANGYGISIPSALVYVVDDSKVLINSVSNNAICAESLKITGASSLMAFTEKDVSAVSLTTSFKWSARDKDQSDHCELYIACGTGISHEKKATATAIALKASSVELSGSGVVRIGMISKAPETYGNSGMGIQTKKITFSGYNFSGDYIVEGVNESVNVTESVAPPGEEDVIADNSLYGFSFLSNDNGHWFILYTFSDYNLKNDTQGKPYIEWSSYEDFAYGITKHEMGIWAEGEENETLVQVPLGAYSYTYAEAQPGKTYRLAIYETIGEEKYVGKSFTYRVPYVSNGVFYPASLEDICYTGFITISGKTYYLKDGQLLKQTTLVKDNNKWYYIQNGIKTSSTMLFKHTDGKWYYVKNGVVTKNTMLFKHTDGKWYYIKNGVVTKSTLLFKHTDGKWYYVKNGVKTNSTLLFKHTDGKWYHIKNGVKTNSTLLFKHTDGKWYHIKNGVKSNDTILFKHTDGKWYYIKNGVKNNSTCVMTYNKVKRYVKSGVWQSGFSGKVKIGTKTYTVKKGNVV